MKIEECKKIFISDKNIEFLDILAKQHSISRTTVLNSLLAQLDFSKFEMGFNYDKEKKK